MPTLRQASPTPFSKMGDTRAQTPVLLKMLDFWFLYVFWHDEVDRALLRQVQSQIKPEEPIFPGFKYPMSDDAREELAYQYLTLRDAADRIYRARQLFAAAVHRLAREFNVKTRWDIAAAWSGLVMGRGEMGIDPVALSTTAQWEIDMHILRAVNPQFEANRIAFETFVAMRTAYPDAD